MIEIKKLTKRYLNYVLSMCTDILDFNTSRFGRPVPLRWSVGDNITPKKNRTNKHLD